VYAAVLALTGLAGCASPEIAPQAADSLAPIRTQANTIEGEIQKTGAAATSLLQNPGADLTPQIDALDNQVNSLKQAVQVGRQDVVAADTAAQNYFAQWDQQLATLSDDLAKSGGVRKEQAEATYGKLRGEIGTFGDQVRSYIADLDESMRYLRTDKTMAGLKTVEPKIRSALSRQPDLLAQLDKVQSQIDAIRGVR
jgi:hypothetical protein